jgi:hypothetical protein
MTLKRASANTKVMKGTPIRVAWAVQDQSNGHWMHAEMVEDLVEISWTADWSERTLIVTKKTARALAAKFDDCTIIRVTTRRVNRNENIEIIKRYVRPMYVDVALHLLKTGALSRSIGALFIPQETVCQYAMLAVSQLNSAGFHRLGERLERARGR